MISTKSKIRQTLLFIKANPNCTTDAKELDGFTVKELYEKGLIDGRSVTAKLTSSPEFKDLHLKPEGENYLTNRSFPEWYLNPFFQRVLAIIITAIIAIIIYYLD